MHAFPPIIDLFQYWRQMVGPGAGLTEIVVVIHMSIPRQADVGRRDGPICPGLGQETDDGTWITAAEGKCIVQFFHRHQQRIQSMLYAMRHQRRGRVGHGLGCNDQVRGPGHGPVPSRIGHALDSFRQPRRGCRQKATARPDIRRPGYAPGCVVRRNGRHNLHRSQRILYIEDPDGRTGEPANGQQIRAGFRLKQQRIVPGQHSPRVAHIESVNVY